MRNVIVTGGNGMVGRALRPYLPDAEFLSRADGDLEVLSTARGLFANTRPRVVVHLAGLVGGIQDNVSRPWDFVLKNILINTNAVQAAVESGVEFFIGIASTCAYPNRVAEYPMREEQLHDGPPAPENFSYGYAKRLLAVELDAATRQCGMSAAVLYPCNMYGPHDSFDRKKSHLVAALIQKVHAAKVANQDKLVLLGTGRPLRQFMYAEDLARVIGEFVHRRTPGHFNVATPENLTVDVIAETVQRALDCQIPRVYTGRLDGQERKDASNRKLMSILPDMRFTPLDEGVRRTYEWYLRNVISMD